MGALTIAFDTIIVGALALTWVAIILHLFFQQDEDQLSRLLGWVSGYKLQAVAGIVLFAAAYTLGSAVSRMAQDFFNDDDLRIPGVLRMAVTEDRIIASVYCNTDQDRLLQAAASSPALAEKIGAFQCLRSQRYTTDGVLQVQAATPPQESECGIEEQKEDKAAAPAGTTTKHPVSLCCGIMRLGRPYLGKGYMEREDDLIEAARDIFGLQENALLMKGEDATLRLRQFHDQIMVLRGATFNGLLALVFCLYAWGARLRSEKPRSIGRWALALVPIFILYFSAVALYYHHHERGLPRPPYMEFSLLVLGGAGVVLLWFPRSQRFDADANAKTTIRWRWPAFSLVFAVLVAGGVMGWWATEIIYGQQVIYSYDALTVPAVPSK